MADDENYQPDPTATRESAGMSEQEGLRAMEAALSPSQPRDPATQRFAAKEQPQEKQPAPVVDIKTGKPAGKEQIGHNGGPELEEDFFEFEPEKEGAEPRRVKADEVFAAYGELPKLKAELEKARTEGPPPQQYLAEMNQMAEARQQYLTGLEFALTMYAPRQPAEALGDPKSDHYDPDAYARQAAVYRRDMEQWEKRRQHYMEQRGLHERQAQQAVQYAQQMAEPKIYEFWPELKDATKRKDILDQAVKLTGFTIDEIKSSHDPRAWRVLKGFIEHEMTKSKQAEAAKVVRAKPKLVKGSARSSTTPTERASTAIEALARTGSDADGVRALESLLFSNK